MILVIHATYKVNFYDITLKKITRKPKIVYLKMNKVDVG
jgi:hypothetical protein